MTLGSIWVPLTPPPSPRHSQHFLGGIHLFPDAGFRPGGRATFAETKGLGRDRERNGLEKWDEEFVSIPSATPPLSSPYKGEGVS